MFLTFKHISTPECLYYTSLSSLHSSFSILPLLYYCFIILYQSALFLEQSCQPSFMRHVSFKPPSFVEFKPPCSFGCVIVSHKTTLTVFCFLVFPKTKFRQICWISLMQALGIAHAIIG